MDDRTLARFMSKVEIRPDGCWYWTGKLNDAGYGYFWLDGKSRLAHRVAHEHFIGPINDDDQVDHLCHTRDESCVGRCDHRACVNPADLEAVVCRVNVMRSRGEAAINAAKDCCDSGHQFDEANTYWYPDGRERGCRTCRRDHWRKWRDKHLGTGRVPMAERNYCPANHEYTLENTYIAPKTGSRGCKICRRIADRESKRAMRARKKAARLTAA